MKKTSYLRKLVIEKLVKNKGYQMGACNPLIEDVSEADYNELLLYLIEDDLKHSFKISINEYKYTVLNDINILHIGITI